MSVLETDRRRDTRFTSLKPDANSGIRAKKKVVESTCLGLGSVGLLGVIELRGVLWQ